MTALGESDKAPGRHAEPRHRPSPHQTMSGVFVDVGGPPNQLAKTTPLSRRRLPRHGPRSVPIAPVIPVQPAGTDDSRSRAARTAAGQSAVLGPADHLPIGAGSRIERLGQRKRAQHLRTATLVLATLFLLGGLPAALLIRDATRDPVFAELDALAIPSWAADSHADTANGSRWCLHRCRFRERTWHSLRLTAETNTVYQAALGTSGWKPWPVAGCPASPMPGEYTCWQRDEYTLDLWIRPAPCDFGVDLHARCDTSLVTVKVRNRIDDPRAR